MVKQATKTKRATKPKFKIASGSAIGKRAKRILSCCNCSYGEPFAVLKPETVKQHGFTGGICPRCKTDSLRLFDSTAEHVYARELQVLQRNGHISQLQYQVRYPLHAYNHDTGKPVLVTSYIADFVYFDNSKNEVIVVDVKGGNSKTVVVSPEAKMKMQWMHSEYGIDVKVIGR